jgi:transposase InsO family protein
VTRKLNISDRTVRRWRSADLQQPPVRCGRPGRPATIEERNTVLRYLAKRGAMTPLYALRHAFPELRRADLADLHQRYRRVQQKKRKRKQSRLKWLVAGAVWAADFKERREPIEGRYGWILSIKDLASRNQLAWQPLEAATAAAVQAVYQRLFDEQGPPLVMKSDNGAQFREEGTKAKLAEHQVTPLYNPVRHPSYNGGVERANGQLAGYQEAVAASKGREGLPTREDAENARQLANELHRRDGYGGQTAAGIWGTRKPIFPSQREAFLQALSERRNVARAALKFEPEADLTHYQQAAVDRRAVRGVLVAQELLQILPKQRRRKVNVLGAASAESALPDENHSQQATLGAGAGKVAIANDASPSVGEARDHASFNESAVNQ